MKSGKIYMIEYIRVIKKFKWIIISVPFIAVLATTVLVNANVGLGMPVYKGCAVIENGSILNSHIIGKKQSQEMIRNYAGLGEDIGFEDVIDTFCFKIILSGSNPEDLKEKCQKISEQYISAANNIYISACEPYYKKLCIYKLKNKILKTNITEMRKEICRLSRTEGENGFNSILIFKNRIIDMRLEMLDVLARISGIKYTLSNSRDFKIIEPISISLLSKGFNKKQKISISFVMGIIGGFLLAFTIENWNSRP